MQKNQFDIRLLLWVTSLVAVAAAFFQGRSADVDSFPDVVFFAMLIVVYPIWWFTREQDSGVRFILIGSVMIVTVASGVFLAVNESMHGQWVVVAWVFRVGAVTLATIMWLSFMLARARY